MATGAESPYSTAWRKPSSSESSSSPSHLQQPRTMELQTIVGLVAAFFVIPFAAWLLAIATERIPGVNEPGYLSCDDREGE